jgi:hypothetical protein
MVIVFQQYFSYIVVVSFIGGEKRSTQRKPPTCRKSLTNFIIYCCIEYTWGWVGFELTALVVINTDCTGSCKFNYHTITTPTSPVHLEDENNHTISTVLAPVLAQPVSSRIRIVHVKIAKSLEKLRWRLLVCEE